MREASNSSFSIFRARYERQEDLRIVKVLPPKDKSPILNIINNVLTELECYILTIVV